MTRTPQDTIAGPSCGSTSPATLPTPATKTPTPTSTPQRAVVLTWRDSDIGVTWAYLNHTTEEA